MAGVVNQPALVDLARPSRRALIAAGGGDLPVQDGGTGRSSLTDGGLLIGKGTAAIENTGEMADGEMVVGDGTTNPVLESGTTLRTSIGVGTGNSPQFTGIELGAASDTTLTRASAGEMNIEGQRVHRLGGTDITVADGGTGVSTLTDGGVLLGSGTGAVTPMSVLGIGELIMGDGATDPVAYADYVGASLIINGDFRVVQRGISFTPSTTPVYVFDHWKYNVTGTPQVRFTITQESSGGPNKEFPYWAKFNVDTAEASVGTGELAGIEAPIEAQDLQHLFYGDAAAKTLACTFWYMSPKTGAHCVALTQDDATRSFVREFTIASADTWEKFTVTFPGDASGTINNDTGKGLRVFFAFVAGSDFQGTVDQWNAATDFATSNQQNLADNTANNIGITGVKLELGSIATSFDHKKISEQLADCYRYYYRLIDIDSGFKIAHGHNITTSSARFTYNTPVVMRGNEATRNNGSVAVSSGTHFSIRETSTLIAGTSTTGSHHAGSTYELIVNSSTAFTAGDGCFMESDTADAFIEFESEL